MNVYVNEFIKKFNNTMYAVLVQSFLRTENVKSQVHKRKLIKISYIKYNQQIKTRQNKKETFQVTQDSVIHYESKHFCRNRALQ